MILKKPPSLFAYMTIVCLCICNSVFIQASAENTETFNLTEIASGVYVHYGKHVEFDHHFHDDIANIGFIVGEKCVAVIDTGGSVKTGKALLSAITRTTSIPICFVINTHVHFDHLLGNIVFKNDKVKFVGHKNLADEVTANRDFFLEQYRHDLGSNPTVNSIVGPDLLVGDNMQLDLGGRILDLKTYDVAHSYSDLSVYDKTTKSLWLSDLLFIERIPSLDGKLKGWLQMMDDLNQTNPERLIAGHGRPDNNSQISLSNQRSYLDVLLRQTRQKIADGMFMEEIIDSVGNQEKQKWLLHEQHHKRNVTKAFSELEWE